MAAPGSLGPSRSRCPGGNPGRRRRGPAAGGRRGGHEVTSGRPCLRRLWKGSRAGSPGGRAGPDATAATAVPSAPLFPFQEDPGEAEPGNQEVPRSDTSCRCYGNGPPASQGGSPGTPPLRRQPRPLHGPPPTVAAAAAAAAILARPGAPSQRHVRAAPAFPPPAWARVQGCRLRARFPRILCKKRRF